MYRIFSAAFLPPQPERLVDLIAGAEVLETMGLPYLAFYHEWVPWRTALFDIDDVIAIDTEYTRMFATGVAGAVSPPTESFYSADPIRGEVGEILADLLAVYNRYRLEPTEPVAVSTAASGWQATLPKVVEERLDLRTRSQAYEVEMTPGGIVHAAIARAAEGFPEPEPPTTEIRPMVDEPIGGCPRTP